MKYILLLLSLTLTTACQSTKNDTLYQRLGAEQGIEHLVNDFLYILADFPEVSRFFADSDIDRFHEKLSEQLCQISDGPCIYSGHSMEKSHKNLGIKNKDFNAMVEIFIMAMDKQNIKLADQNELLSKLAPMHRDIIQ